MSETTVSRPWQRTFYPQTVVVCRPRRHAVSVIVNATEIETWTARLAPGAMTTLSMIVSAETGKTRESGSIAAALIEVRMTSSPTEMNVQQLLAVVDRKRKMTTPAGIPEIQRYVKTPTLSSTCKSLPFFFEMPKSSNTCHRDSGEIVHVSAPPLVMDVTATGPPNQPRMSEVAAKRVRLKNKIGSI